VEIDCPSNEMQNLRSFLSLPSLWISAAGENNRDLSAQTFRAHLPERETSRGPQGHGVITEVGPQGHGVVLVFDEVPIRGALLG
jgi:hypothetical protein